MRRVLTLLAVVLAASACGQKGALYYRDDPPASVKAPRTDPYKPVPYPKSVTSDAERDGAPDSK